MTTPTRKTLTTAVRAIPGELPSITFTTDTVDAMNDRVIQAGVTVRDPLPILFAHRYDELPVGQATAAMIRREPHATRVTWKWLENDSRAAAVRNAFAQGMLGSSIGMRVLDAERNEVGGFDLLKVEAIEASLTPVPANPDCVRLLKSLGWSTAPELVLHLEEDDAPVLRLVEDELVRLDPGDLAHAVRTYLADEVRAALRERERGMVVVDHADVAAAMAEVIGGEVQRHLRLARGRLD